jgi:hypothetical protein
MAARPLPLFANGENVKAVHRLMRGNRAVTS